MVTWKLLTDDVAKRTWDKSLDRFADCSPFQSYAFGEYQRNLGWQPYHWAATNEEGDVTALCLGLVRRYLLGVGIVWCGGGPVGDVRCWDQGLRDTIIETSGLKRLYFRFRCDQERRVADALFLGHRGWSRSITPMTSSFSMELDLDRGEDGLSNQLHRRWRRNLRLARENDLKVELCTDPDVDEIAAVFAEMEFRKQLPSQFSREKLKKLFKHAGSNLIFYRCEDADGNLICVRGALVTGSRACDYLAATTGKGRELRASYAVLWHLIRQCRENGVRTYDLGGIDPWGNPGVYAFKKDTGAREVESLGEWDWATSPALRFLGNWAIGRRKRANSAEPIPTSSSPAPSPPPLVLSGSPAESTTTR